MRFGPPVCLLLLLAAGPGPARAQSEVASLLDQLSRTVRELYLNGYVVDIDYHNWADPHYGPDVGGTAFDPNAISAPDFHRKDDGGYDRITMARLGERFRFVFRNKVGGITQWTTDGHTLWCYREDLNAYTRTAAPPWPKELGSGPGLPGDEWEYLTKFLAIAGMADHARIVSDDLPPDADCPGPSALVELTLTTGRDAATERLRILTQSHLPCRDTIDQTYTHGLAISTDRHRTITWKFHPDPPPPGYFTFAPRKHAKKVKRFPRNTPLSPFGAR